MRQRGVSGRQEEWDAECAIQVHRAISIPRQESASVLFDFVSPMTIKKTIQRTLSTTLIVLTLAIAPSIASSMDEVFSKESLLEKIEADGVQKNSVIWTKQPLQVHYSHIRIPAFTKITYLDADMVPEIPPLKNSRSILIMIASVLDKEEKLVISNSQFYSKILAIDSNFYLQDPGKIAKKWGRRVMTAISQQTVFRGMTDDQVTASWGYPKKKSRTVGSWGKDEQWIYGEFPDSKYLYLHNNKLTGWQN